MAASLIRFSALSAPSTANEAAPRWQERHSCPVGSSGQNAGTAMKGRPWFERRSSSIGPRVLCP
ncbi:hypothetical protein AXF42_Ash012504 [Apostasia shenzhenica]|uniref:Uncharacterized protein n=1 Tax=Apostasia shenzhenica TaxID=1088818 RepID=A0A2I0AQY6_9ASPA|nr:hypothetical protein AXF42_Ash012504 [Apostasia shenzhenica]